MSGTEPGRGHEGLQGVGEQTNRREAGSRGAWEPARARPWRSALPAEPPEPWQPGLRPADPPTHHPNPLQIAALRRAQDGN
jgi:hypothetical protein